MYAYSHRPTSSPALHHQPLRLPRHESHEISRLTSFLRWFSLLSLDAVFVALSWQEVLARAVAIHLHWEERALLGISVWIVYILDHLLDSIAATQLEKVNRAPRHHFAHNHRISLFGAVAIAFVIDSALLFKVSFSLLFAGSILGVITLSYLTLNTFFLARHAWLQGREIIISLIFTLGCGLVPFVQAPHKSVLLAPILGLFLLTIINCILIARLEQQVTIESLSSRLILSPAWIIPSALLFLFLNETMSGPPSVIAFLGSLIGLSLVPILAKRVGYELASLATDGALIAGALISFLR